MPDVTRFECASKDGTDLKVYRRAGDNGGVWLDAGSPRGPFVMVLLTNDDARALGQRLIELAGGAARHIYKLGSGIPVRIEQPKDDERGGKT
jgi:hypothetical protein